jgi:hypothetical protein
VLAVEKERSGSGSSLVWAVGGGIVAALVLWWFIGIVIGTIVFATRIIVIGALVGGGLWLWGKFTKDDEE